MQLRSSTARTFRTAGSVPHCSRRLALIAWHSAVDGLAASVPPLALDVLGIVIAARAHTHQNASFADTGFVLLDAFLGDTLADHRAKQRACGASGPGARECRCHRPGDHETQSG